MHALPASQACEKKDVKRDSEVSKQEIQEETSQGRSLPRGAGL